MPPTSSSSRRSKYRITETVTLHNNSIPLLQTRSRTENFIDLILLSFRLSFAFTKVVGPHNHLRNHLQAFALVGRQEEVDKDFQMEIQ